LPRDGRNKPKVKGRAVRWHGLAPSNGWRPSSPRNPIFLRISERKKASFALSGLNDAGEEGLVIASSKRAVMPKGGEKPANRLREVTALLDSPQISALFDKVRTAVEPPPTEAAFSPPVEPPQTGRGSRLATAATALVVLFSWCCYGGTNSPWMQIPLPGGTHSTNVVAGDTCLYNGDFFPTESLVPLRQLDLLKGTQESASGSVALDDPHMGYAVLGNLFTAGLNPPYALRALNLVLIGICVWIVKRLTERLFEDRIKSQLAAALFALSIAATAHVGDLSPHVLAIAFCYLWTLLLVQIEVRQKPLTGPMLVGLSALLGAWSLVSTTSLFGLATLACVLFKRRQFVAAVLPGIAWFVVPSLQQRAFAYFGIATPELTDAGVVWLALSRHLASLAAHPFGYTCYQAVEVANVVFNDNPLNVLAGLLGLMILRHRAKWLLWACYLAPVAVGLVLLPTTSARGSLAAGNTIVVFAVVSHFAVEASRWAGRRLGSALAAVPIVGLLAAQAIWGQSSLVGWNYPAASYATGAFENAGLVRPTEFVPMISPSGGKPNLTKGTVTAGSAYGLGDGFGRQAVLPVKRLAPYADHWSGLPALLRSLMLEAPVIFCLWAAAVFLMRWRGSLLTTLLLVIGLGSAHLCGAAIGLDHHVLRLFDDRIALKEDEKILAQIDLSAEFREQLERSARDNSHVEFALRLRGANQALAKPAEVQVDEWTSDEPRFSVDATAFLDALKAHHGRVELAISPKAGSRGLTVHSWQNLNNPEFVTAPGSSDGGREARVVRADGSIEPLEWFPSFEIRVVRGNNRYPFQSVIGPYLASRPSSYVLVGF
jgi:hypothetical protein